MFTYPHLTLLEQASLPVLVAPPSAIPNKFEDSTHQLFYCQTSNSEMVLKVCNQATIEKSPFWSGANRLFAADFPNSLGNIDLTHDFLEQNGTLNVPDFVAASANRYVLTRFLAGKDVDPQHIPDQSVIQLAEHIAKLHQCTYASWGKLHAPQFSSPEWAGRLHEALAFLVRKNDICNAAPSVTKVRVTEVLAQAKNIRETDFVPVMLDLRWDQFRFSDSGSNKLALIDLDAFVIAPRALDLVLLEYVLTAEQLELFRQHYTRTHGWPEHNANKPCYQLLLFLMNILGETDLEKWMQRI